MTDTAVPTQAQTVGGGIVGTAVAYHLTRLGRRDVILVEQGRLSSGATWHAAGLVGQLRLAIGRAAADGADDPGRRYGIDLAGQRLAARLIARPAEAA